MGAMEARIVSSAKGPMVLFEDLALHMTDTQGLIYAVNSTPLLLQNLEKSLIDHFEVVSDFAKQNLISKNSLQANLVHDAVSAMNDFFTFAYKDYLNYLRMQVLDKEPNLSGEKLDAAVRRTSREDINSFYAKKQS